MNILLKDADARNEILKEWKKEPLQFTPLISSTCVVNGQLNNVHLHEKDLVDIACSGNIIGIDSNYYHIRDEKAPPVKAKRPKKVNPKKKPRSIQGDGGSFNSQVTFTVAGTFTRENPTILINGIEHKLREDAHAKKATPVQLGDPEYDETKTLERITKEYKVKVFRTGHVSIPGVLKEDLSDADQALKDLTEYLSDLFDVKATVAERFTTTRNYKFITQSGSLDLLKFQAYCNNHFTTLLNTRWENIEGFIVKPVWIRRGFAPETVETETPEIEISSEPQVKGDFMGVYHSFARIRYDDEVLGLVETADPAEQEERSKLRMSKLPNQLADFGEFYLHLQNCTKVTNLYVKFTDLCKKLLSADLLEWHSKTDAHMKALADKYFVTFSDDVVERIKRVVLNPIIENVKKSFNKSKNNMMSNINYNPEIFAGFVVKIKTPTPDDATKQTTIKLFSSGKINIDGANNLHEAEFIYYWLNHIFVENPTFIYDEAIEEVEDEDDNFSYTDDEVDDTTTDTNTDGSPI
jgi:TATA-box binding protein (TBP) (component of TFIID and TFIIIB)